MLEKDTDKLQGMSTYIDGKIKRYQLMFAVNGGAFALAKLMKIGEAGHTTVMGNLTLWQLALGSIIFTFVILVDIWLWAQNMKDGFLGRLVFNTPGKIILLLMGALITLAWAIVAFSSLAIFLLLGALLVLALLLFYFSYRKTKKLEAVITPQ